jgi:hypothetical protein
MLPNVVTTFFTYFKGTPTARQAGPCRPIACEDAEITPRNRELARGEPPEPGGVAKRTRLLRGGSLPRPRGGSPPGATLPPVGSPRTRRQAVLSLTRLR